MKSRESPGARVVDSIASSCARYLGQLHFRVNEFRSVGAVQFHGAEWAHGGLGVDHRLPGTGEATGLERDDANGHVVPLGHPQDVLQLSACDGGSAELHA